jgi:hypothetical protein
LWRFSYSTFLFALRQQAVDQSYPEADDPSSRKTAHSHDPGLINQRWKVVSEGNGTDEHSKAGGCGRGRRSRRERIRQPKVSLPSAMLVSFSLVKFSRPPTRCNYGEGRVPRQIGP